MPPLTFPFWIIVPLSPKLGDGCASPVHVSMFSSAARAIAYLEGNEDGQWDVRLVARSSRKEIAAFLKHIGANEICHEPNPDGTGGHTIKIADLLATWAL